MRRGNYISGHSSRSNGTWSGHSFIRNIYKQAGINAWFIIHVRGSFMHFFLSFIIILWSFFLSLYGIQFSLQGCYILNTLPSQVLVAIDMCWLQILLLHCIDRRQQQVLDYHWCYCRWWKWSIWGRSVNDCYCYTSQLQGKQGTFYFTACVRRYKQHPAKDTA